MTTSRRTVVAAGSAWLMCAALRVADVATFEKPFQYPTGIPIVIVNGRVALRDGQQSPIQAGRTLRSSPTRES